eukprot:TRINITY_DN28088_c0_g1_i1.p1 TRINITY_DN28088_c0_g1~~TRINITY_DN28088_c0_g1_i1.p1  ORF type:complete len:352 (+),score=110.21 TRINITY_DN28088_c0_g1_i1:59-1114(+)
MATMQRGGLLHAVASFLIVFLACQQWGATVAVFVGLTGQITGLFCFFPVLYRLYTSNLLGYNILRNLLHPRQPRPHSHVDVWRHPDIPGVSVMPVAVLADNYAYLLWCNATMRAVAIDPADPHAVYAAADRLGLTITTILATHKHWDHAGGNRELKAILAARGMGEDAVEVLGSREDHPHSTTQFIGEGSCVTVGENVQMTFKMVPGHTRGHVLTLVTSAEGDADAATLLFTGDSLFCCGVGMFFECDDVADLQRTYDVYHALDRATCYIFPGHEYSEMLANQAVACDGTNHAARKCLSEFHRLRKHKHCTVPSLLDVEMEANPFLRIPKSDMHAFTTPQEVQSAMYNGRI